MDIPEIALNTKSCHKPHNKAVSEQKVMLVVFFTGNIEVLHNIWSFLLNFRYFPIQISTPYEIGCLLPWKPRQARRDRSDEGQWKELQKPLQDHTDWERLICDW